MSKTERTFDERLSRTHTDGLVTGSIEGLQCALRLLLERGDAIADKVDAATLVYDELARRYPEAVGTSTFHELDDALHKAIAERQPKPARKRTKAKQACPEPEPDPDL